MKHLTLSLIAIFFATLSARSNNLVIGTPSVNGSGQLQFTIQWDNSWNTTLQPSNWDAVWVFVKRQSCSDLLWNHVPVSTTSANHSVTGGVLQVDAVTDGMGVCVRRAAAGSGNISSSTVTLTLQTAANNVDNYMVFGVEMVAVPQGNFFIGDGRGMGDNFRFNTQTITQTMQNAGIGVQTNYAAGGQGCTASLPATFPLGWNNFYCMKYELSQEQYVGFLNTLPYLQQVNRVATSPASPTGTLALGAMSYRIAIKVSTSGAANSTPAVFACDLNNNNVFNEAADGQNIACGGLSVADLMAYLDWAALRPMTEFEYEKACRGQAANVTNSEMPWGSAVFSQATPATLNNAGTATETFTSSNAGMMVYNCTGLLRCGYAAQSATTKAQAGASWYGIMEMAGNVYEPTIGGYNSDYSGFTTTNGDGTLTAAGSSNVPNWPVAYGQFSLCILKGGGCDNNADRGQVSDRNLAGTGYSTGRNNSLGGRGVRSF